MTIKTIRNWFEWTLLDSLSYYQMSVNKKGHSKRLRMAERALNELKKYRSQ